jgi:DNA-binding winged helix-turn-helix (wHTH) protein
MSQQTNEIYEFGSFRLDRQERLLWRDGAAISLTPKAFDLLLVLVERHGRLVEKEELFNAVWPDTIVEESNLSSNIALIRKALRDGVNELKFIETVPKSGYRFVAEVRQQNGAGAKPVVEESVTSVSTSEMQPTTSEVGSSASRNNRSVIILCVLAFLLPAFISVGVWQYFRLEKRAEVTQLEFKGNFYLRKWKEDEVRKSIEYYNKAVTLDPNSA